MFYWGLKRAGTMLKIHFLNIFILLAFLSGCFQEKEEIQPAWEAIKVHSFSLLFPIEPVLVEGSSDRLDGFPGVGRIFRELAKVFTNIYLYGRNGTEVETEPKTLYFPELDQVIDWSVIEKLEIGSVQLHLKDGKNLDFIKGLKVYLSFGELIGEHESSLESRVLVLSYDRKENATSLSCRKKCLSLITHPVDWVSILKNNRTFVLETEVAVRTAPSKELKIGGFVSVNVAVNF